MTVWIATITCLNSSGTATTLRYSDGAYTDTDWNFFEPRMLQPALIKVSPDDGGTFNVFSSPSIGYIELINKDGALNPLADYYLDNGTISLSLVDEFGQQTDYLTGKVEAPEWRNDRVNLIIRSMSEVLGRNHPSNKYVGSNSLPAGVEGVLTDIKGNVKPKIHGSVKNASPVLVNTARLIYQFSDRTNCTVSAVYDKGAALTLGTTYTQAQFSTFETTAVTAGQFNRCMGFVKLGSAPTGTVTGDAADSSVLAGDVFEQILGELSPAIAFDATSKATLNAAGQIGLFVTSETSTASLLNQIVASVGGYWFFQGSTLHANLIALATSSVLEITNSEIVSIDRSATGLGKNGIPFAACTINYNKIETVQSETDLVGSVTAARKAELSQQSRSVLATNSTTLSRHPLADYINIDSVLRNESDAQAVATRLLNLASNRVDVVTITAVVCQIPALTIGTGVNVITDKLGYDDGKILTITGFEIDAKRKRISMELIG